MGGSSKQTIGYKYFGGLMAVIGNPIERFLGINPDNKGWLMAADQDPNENLGRTGMSINQPNLFGGSNQEGGWVGNIDIYAGREYQKQNEYLAEHIDKDISAYPNLSYMVFRGYDSESLEPSLKKGFELVSMSGMMKDFMIWVKRTRVRNDGRLQWYERNSKGQIVCEIGARYDTGSSNDIVIGETQYVAHEYFKYNNDIYRDNNQILVASNSSGGFAQSSWGQISTGDIPIDDKFECSAGLEFHDISGICDVEGYVQIYAESATVDVVGFFDFYWESELSFRGRTYFKAKSQINGYREIKINGNSPIENSVTTKIFGGSVLFYLKNPRHGEAKSTDFFDINPIHKAREIITDDTAMNKPESLINDDNFMAMADRIWDEGLGISWCIQEKSCKEALEELEYHIEGGFRINRQTGLYECILFRDDFLDLDNALSFNESNIKSIEFDLVNSDDQPSSVNVNYYDRELIKNSNFYLYENGLARTRGFDVTQNLEFPYFMNRRNAELVGNWKLKQLSTATWKGSFKTGVLDARKLNKYDVIKLSWVSKNLSDLPVRVMKINLGDGVNNTVTIDFVEVIPYSNISYSKTAVDPHTDDRLPPQDNVNTAFEMPYFESVQRFGQTQVDAELSETPEIGYLMMSAAKPQSNSLNAQLYSDGATGAISSIQKVSVIDYCPALLLKSPIGYLDTLLDVESITYQEGSGQVGFSGATQGTWIILNNEIMVFESYDFENNRISVKRGALDTVPQKHEQGTIFFSDEFSGVDPTQYILGETVRSQSLTTTPSAILDKAYAQIRETEFNARAIRPYPPANVKINGAYWPEYISGGLQLTWSNRNRLQQTGGEILGYFEGSVALESGVQTLLDLTEYDANNIEIATHNSNITGESTYILEESQMQIDTRTIRILLKTVRDTYECINSFDHVVHLSNLVAPADVTFEVIEI